MKQISIVAAFLLMALASHAQLPAFKGAEGFGAQATGGRGREVYHVTSLDDDGPGSFREGVSRPGRNIVFDIGGVIKLKSRINVSGDITIAGQTAPGPGITFYGESLAFNKISNVVVRYIRMRGSINMARGSCVLVADSSDNLIFDHVSVAWGRWDDLHIKGSSNITLQYCLIGESLDPQRFGALLEHPQNISVHHCLWIDNQSRNPKAKAGIEYINNVMYNWGGSGITGGHSFADHYQDFVGNYFIAGPSSAADHYFSLFTASDHVYLKDNYADTNRDGRLNGEPVKASVLQTAPLQATIVNVRQHNPPVPVQVQSAASAYTTVLQQAGCSLHRDKTDIRLISQLESLGKEGDIIWTETQVGGQEKQTPVTTIVTDKDRDGMDDKWERKQGLNPADASDTDKTLPGGYTALETYWETLLPARQ